jgi:hypothetical protein
VHGIDEIFKCNLFHILSPILLYIHYRERERERKRERSIEREREREREKGPSIYQAFL